MHKAKKITAQFRAAEVPQGSGAEKPKTRDAAFTREMSCGVEIVTRAAEGDKPETKSVRLSVSSEEPYLKWVWDSEAKDYVRAYEVLGHQPGEIDFSRMKGGLVIQLGHYGRQIGIIDAPEVKDGKLGGVVRFGHSQEAKDTEADALDGICKNMSVGYFVKEYKRDGVAADGYPIFRAVKWQPFEGSFVNVPADPTVGVGRSETSQPTNIPDGAAAPSVKENKMNEEQIKAAIAAAVKEGTADAMKRVEQLEAELKALKEKKPDTPTPDAKKSLNIFDAKDQAEIAKRYNILKAIRCMATVKGEVAPDAGFEREISDQIAKALKRDARGFYVPESVFVNAMAYQRAMTGKTNVEGQIVGNGAATVATELLAAQYIAELVATTILGKAGVSVLDGLQGDISIPKGTAVTAGWIDEKSNAPTVSPTFSNVNGSPHTCAANAIITRRLIMQSSLGVQSLVAQLILEAIGREVEKATFDGTGNDNQPLGLSGTTGVGAVNMTAGKPTKADLVEFWEKVYTANANGTNMSYIMSPAVKALLCKTRDFAVVENKAKSENVGGVGGEYLCTKDGNVEGYPVIMSGLCNAKKIYFGAWSNILMAFWSGVDMIVDPYTFSSKNALQLSAFQDVDVLVRHPEAFAIGQALA